MTRFRETSPEFTRVALLSTGLLKGYIVPCCDVLHTFGKDYIVEDLTDELMLELTNEREKS